MRNPLHLHSADQYGATRKEWRPLLTPTSIVETVGLKLSATAFVRVAQPFRLNQDVLHTTAFLRVWVCVHTLVVQSCLLTEARCS